MRSRRTKSGWIALALCCCGVGPMPACTVPRQVHGPIEYSGLDLACSALELEVVDARPAPPEGVPRDSKQLSWPREFEDHARQRLLEMVGGSGPALRIVSRVAAADELELVDARGEMTRVLVTLAFDVQVKDGPMLRHAEAQSVSDIPRHEATPEEIDFVLGATAVNAFDRYWASAATVGSLNRELEAYARRHGSVTPAPPARAD